MLRTPSPLVKRRASSNNAPGDEAAAFGAKPFVANAGFNHDVLRIATSDLGAPLRKHSLGIKVRSCVSAMSVIITSAEIYW